MEAFSLIYLSMFGLIFGSFASVIIFRLYSGEKGIIGGRSHCPQCNTTLNALDLIPVFSYIFTRGKCRHCSKGIPLIYPVLEITMGFCFYLVGLYLVDINLILAGSIMEIIRLVFFLSVVFIGVVLSFYDILYQLIPIELLGPGILLTLILHVIGFIFPTVSIFTYFKLFETASYNQPIINGLLGALFIYSFFYLQILLPGIYYAIEKKKYNVIRYELIEYITLPFWMIASIFTKNKGENEEDADEDDEVYTFMGHGDLWIGVFMGLVGGFKIALLGLVMAYLLGSIVGIYILAIVRKRNYRMAFGPFLSAGLLISLIYYEPITTMFFNFIRLN